MHKVDEEVKDVKEKVVNLEPSTKEQGIAIIKIEEQVGSLPEKLENVKVDFEHGIETQKDAIDKLREDYERDLTNMDEKLQGIRETLAELDKEDIDELMKARENLDEKLQDLENRVKDTQDVTQNTLNVSILDIKNDNENALKELENRIDVNIKELAGELEEELKRAKTNFENTQVTLLESIDGAKADGEKAIGELESKLNDAVLELYNKDLNGMKEDLDSVKGETKRNGSELDNVASLVQNVQINIGEVRTQFQEEDVANKEQIRKLRKFNISNQTHQFVKNVEIKR